MVKKIFVTGASGVVGRAVVKRLKDNFSLTLLLAPEEPAIGLGKQNIVRGDITRPRSLAGLIKGHDTVIHLAEASGQQGWRNCLSLNVDGTRNIAKKAVKAGVIRFIHLSSVAVYGRVPQVTITEEQPCKKIKDAYGDTKIEAEKIVRKFAQKNRIDLTILRPTAAYGEGENTFFPWLLERLQSGKFRIIGDGRHPVDLVHAADIADAVYLTLLKPESVGQTYNIANGENPSWNRLLEEICPALDIPFPHRSLSYKTACRRALIMEFLSAFSNKQPRLSRHLVRLIGRKYDYSIRKARKELGFEPSVNPIEGILECIRNR